MEKIGIIGAMQIEIDWLKNLMAKEGSAKTVCAGGLDFETGKIHGKEVVVVRSGVGKVNAALCAQRLILQFNCTNIINTGIAGAMAEGLGVLDFVVSCGLSRYGRNWIWLQNRSNSADAGLFVRGRQKNGSCCKKSI